MNPLFSFNNAHLNDPRPFSEADPHLRALQNQPYVFRSPLLKTFPFQTPGVYTLGGGRQIGKTTFLKQWMEDLLQKGISPSSIFFLTGELIDDHMRLIHIMREALEEMSPSHGLMYIIIDEVTYIKEWDKAIKFLVDSRVLENCVVLLTGSDLVLMQEARMRFPGRRGTHHQVDFHYYPLSFREYVDLVHGDSHHEIDVLYEAFEKYLSHGGFLTAINNVALTGKIFPSTFQTYSDWIRGDFLKQGKKEGHLRDFLSAILKTHGTQITWTALTHHTEIDHHKTLQDYADLMQSMDGLFIQEAIVEHKLAPAPKKAKRLFFADPFIYHAICMWLKPHYCPTTALEDPMVLSSLVETSVINAIRRVYQTYYIKAEGEVDVAYIKKNAFYPIEIKWTNQLRPKDLRQIKKYPKAQIWSKVRSINSSGDTPVLPLPQALYEFK